MKKRKILLLILLVNIFILSFTPNTSAAVTGKVLKTFQNIDNSSWWPIFIEKYTYSIDGINVVTDSPTIPTNARWVVLSSFSDYDSDVGYISGIYNQRYMYSVDGINIVNSATSIPANARWAVLSSFNYHDNFLGGESISGVRYKYSIDGTAIISNSATIPANAKWATAEGYQMTDDIVWNWTGLPVFQDYIINNDPVVTISNSSSNITISNSGTITLGGKAHDIDNNNVTISTTINGITKSTTLSPAPTTSSGTDNWSLTWNGSELAEGNYTNISITANDGNGGTSNSNYTGTIKVDKTPPTVNITSPLNLSLTNINTPQINFTVNEFATTIVKVDGNVVPKVSGDILDTLADGVHSIIVEATDAAGNIGTASISFTVDSTPPEVDIISILDNSFINDNTPLLNFTVNEIATVIVKVDDVVVPKVSGDSLDTLAEGSHTFTVDATDPAGNQTIVTKIFTVDTIAPIVDLTAPLDNVFINNLNPTLLYTANEGTVVVKVDGNIVSKISGQNLDLHTEGMHTISVTATDQAGNITSVTHTITIDRTPPTISILPPPGNVTSDTTPLLNYTVSDGTVVVKVDGNVVPKVSGDSLDILAEGSHTVTVQATDEAGNIGTASITFTVDTTTPVINILTPVNGTTLIDDTPMLSYSLSEGTAIVKVDGNIVTKTSGHSLDVLSEGEHTLTIIATDQAGNSSTASSTFTIDKSAPIVTILSPINGFTTNDNTPEINYIVNEGNVVVRVDGQIVNKTSGQSLDSLSEGIHTLRVQSTDVVGNVGAAQITFTVDTTAPTLNILSPANGSTIAENSPILSYFASEGTTVVKVDGIVVSKVAGQRIDALTNGNHTIEIEANDLAGNKSTATTSFTVNSTSPVQTVPSPTVKITAPINDITTNNKNPQILYTVSNGSVQVKLDNMVVNKTSGQTLEDLSDGIHTLRVEATDQYGNTGTAQIIFKVDATGPIINILSPINGSTLYEVKPKLTYTISEGVAIVKVDGNVVSKTSGQNLDNLSLGLHTVTIDATDLAGNTSMEQSTFTVSTQTSETPNSSIPDISEQLPSYISQPPDNFKYQFDPFSQNTNVAGIEAVPMTELERDMYFNSQADGQDGPLKVTVSPLRGTFENPQVVNLAVNKPAIIYYTTNGSNPTIESEMFSAPILVDQNMTIKYFAKDGDGKTTPIQSQKYTIKNSNKSLGTALKTPQKTSSAQNQQIKQAAQEGEIDSSLIFTALGWVLLTTAVGSILTLKG